MKRTFSSSFGLVRKRVCVGVSGGVDSAVSAYILKRAGYDVTGVFMKNWSKLEEYGGCYLDADRRDAEVVCRHLGIPLFEASFETEY